MVYDDDGLSGQTYRPIENVSARDGQVVGTVCDRALGKDDFVKSADKIDGFRCLIPIAAQLAAIEYSYDSCVLTFVTVCTI